MSYISKKKRSTNYIAPTMFLVAGITTVAGNVSADTVTGWDTNGSNSANIGNVSGTLSSATSDITSAANSKASSNTSAAPSVSGSTTTGWIDVYVDHNELDDAVRNATAQGVSIVRDPSVVLEGDSVHTASNASSAASYYTSKAAEIKSVAAKYTNDMANYNATVVKNKADADAANSQMDALRTNLASQGQTVKLTAKTYSATGLASDTAKIQQSIANGRAYLDAKNSIQNANTQQSSLTLFTTAAAQGNVKLDRKTVTISTPAGAQAYLDKLATDYTNLQNYLNNLNGQTGQIPEDQKPTYTLYNFVIDSNVEQKGMAPVEVFSYTPIAVSKPATPSLNYNLFDIRSKPTNSSGWDNKDGETIIINPNGNAGGNKVAQAIVNQTVGIDTDNQPLPSERFDKIHDLTIITKLPDDVEFNKALTNSNPDHWTVAYDEASRTVTQTATAKYLVQINLNQNVNDGSTGGTVNGEWKYDAPQVFFKLLKDDKTYQSTSTTIVNHEYMVVGEGIQIRTDSADPTKVNTNNQYQNIDGKAVLPGSINNYVLGWDFNQYKGVNIDSEMQQKGLELVDDYPEEAVSLTGPISVVDPVTGEVLYTAAIPKGVTVGSTGEFKSANGKTVDGFTWKVIDNDSAPDNLKGKLTGQAIMISYTGHDNAFYKKYVEGGHSLNVVMPMTTLKTDNTPDKDGGSYNGNSYANVAWQSDFGNEYKSNDVKNTVPTLDPNKDAVLDFANLGSLDINNNPSASIENSTYFKYRLSGSKLPSNLSEDVKSYKFVDTMDTNSDSYDGTFIVQTGSAMYFKAGSMLAQRYPNGVPVGSDISKYFTQTVTRDSSGNGQNSNNKTIKRIEINADADFLAQIDYSKTNFQVDAFVTTKRIANNQGVMNTFQEVINGIDYGSNKVVTNTRKNAIDELNDQVNSLSSNVSDNNSAISSMANGMSVIIRDITKFESNATSTAKSYFDYTSEQISILVSNANSTANSIANSASSAIASNSTAIGSVASDTKSQVSSATSSMNSLISSLASALNSKTDQALSTITIFEPSVKTEADALTYAVNQGVAPGSIKSIEKNTAGRFVVTFNNSKTGINNSKPMTVGDSTKPATNTPATNTPATNTPATNTPATPATNTPSKSVTFKFYLLNSKEEAYAKIESMGYARSAVKSVSENNGVYTVVVNKS